MKRFVHRRQRIFEVTDNEIENVTLKEDLRTVALTLKKEVEDLSDIEVKVDGVKDVTGNTSSLMLLMITIKMVS